MSISDRVTLAQFRRQLTNSSSDEHFSTIENEDNHV